MVGNHIYTIYDAWSLTIRNTHTHTSLFNQIVSTFYKQVVKEFDERLHHMSCRYWRLNDPFCCVYRSRYCQRFLMGWTISKIAHFLYSDLDPHPTHGSLDPHESILQTASRSVQPFSQGARTWPTDRHTDSPRYYVCSNRPHLTIAVMRPKMK